MPALNYFLADVFTDHPFGGNPLAVFPQVNALSTNTMQAIARELNLSETVFVFATNRADTRCDLRIFTPGSELPCAGHPTIGTALVLEAIDDLRKRPNVATAADGSLNIILGEGVGPVPVKITRTEGIARAVLTSPRIPKKYPLGLMPLSWHVCWVCRLRI